MHKWRLATYYRYWLPAQSPTPPSDKTQRAFAFWQRNIKRQRGRQIQSQRQLLVLSSYMQYPTPSDKTQCAFAFWQRKIKRQRGRQIQRQRQLLVLSSYVQFSTQRDKTKHEFAFWQRDKMTKQWNTLSWKKKEFTRV